MADAEQVQSKSMANGGEGGDRNEAGDLLQSHVGQRVRPEAGRGSDPRDAAVRRAAGGR